MTQQNELQSRPVKTPSVGKRMLQGAGLALILIILFLVGAGEPNPSWPKLWMIRPLIIVPLAGALGGVFFYLVDLWRYEGGWRKALAILSSLIGYTIVLWLGVVLGLDGTWWD